MATYTTKGERSGSCGHKHRTLEAAFACLGTHASEQIKKKRPPTDRTIARSDGEAFTDAEQEELQRMGIASHPADDTIIYD